MACHRFKLIYLLLFFSNLIINTNSKRGPRPKVPLEVQKDVYLQFKDDFCNGVIPPISHTVYNSVQSALKHKMTKKGIQMSIKTNYVYFFGHVVCNGDSSLNDKKTLPIVTESMSCSSSDTNSTIYETDNSLNDDSPPNSIIHFLCIDKITWEEIKPKYYHYRRNSETGCKHQKRLKLQINRWTNVIQGQLWNALKLCCTWCFKGNFAKNDFEVTCKGYCKQCHANITITSQLKTENLIELKCLITNWHNDYKHFVSVKNHIRARTRHILSQSLQNRSSISIRNELAFKLMQKNDKEPSVLPKLETLRQIKHQSRKSLHFHKNLILSLTCMAFTPPYDKCVRAVSALPFYVYYWTDDQINYYQNCQKTLNFIRLTIDATGSLFCKKIRPIVNEQTEVAEKSQAPIFLYTIMTDTTVKSSVPLGQFISESHTMASISHWLHTWLSGRKPPNEVVTDDSAALIGAVVKAFCGYNSTNEYLDSCFKLLENESDKVPICHVRLDTSHFFKTLYNLTVFKHVDTRIIHFYVQCFKQIKNSISYNQVKQIVQDIIIVSKHKCRGTKNGQQTRCESSLQKLRNIITADEETGNLEHEKNADYSNVENNNIFEDTDIDVDTTLIKYIEDVDAKEDLLITLSGDDVTDFENMFYFPLLKGTLIRLLRKLPMWGNIMCPFFQSDVCNPTSSNIESHFRDIKKLFFNFNFGKLRIDEFIIKHYTLITGALRLGSSDLNSLKTKKEIDINSRNEDDMLYDNSIFKDNPKYIEDWRGLVSKKNKKIRTTRVTLHVLRNGTISTSGNSKIFTNTCAFDSVVQSLAIAYLDYPRFKKYISDKKINNLTKLIQSLIRSKPKSKQQYTTKGIYDARANILMNIFGNETAALAENIIDCVCNVSRIIDNIATYDYYSAGRRLKCTNINCDVNKDNIRKCSWIPLNTNTIESEGLKALSEAALITDSYRKCKNTACVGYNTYEYDLSDIIFFEFNYETAVNIDDFPKTIELNGKRFQILAIIDYINNGRNSIGHYRTRCFRRRAKIWQCYDDMLPTQSQSISPLIVPHCATYIRL